MQFSCDTLLQENQQWLDDVNDKRYVAYHPRFNIAEYEEIFLRLLFIYTSCGWKKVPFCLNCIKRVVCIRGFGNYLWHVVESSRLLRRLKVMKCTSHYFQDNAQTEVLYNVSLHSLSAECTRSTPTEIIHGGNDKVLKRRNRYLNVFFPHLGFLSVK